MGLCVHDARHCAAPTPAPSPPTVAPTAIPTLVPTSLVPTPLPTSHPTVAFKKSTLAAQNQALGAETKLKAAIRAWGHHHTGSPVPSAAPTSVAKKKPPVPQSEAKAALNVLDSEAKVATEKQQLKEIKKVGGDCLP